MAKQSKAFWKSSTLWINVVPFLVLLLDSALELKVVKDADWLLILTGVANILNRLRPAKKLPLRLK